MPEMNGFELREYGKYEFCRSVDCVYYAATASDRRLKCRCVSVGGCVRTAKEFHQWLKENDFGIFTPLKENE